MKRMKSIFKKTLCLMLVCLTILSIAAPSFAYSAQDATRDPNIVGEYKKASSWSKWSGWTSAKLVESKINTRIFTGSPWILETDVEAHTCYVRKDGIVDTFYNPVVALFKIGGGYQKNPVTMYRFRVRVLHWVNKEYLSVPVSLMTNNPSKASFYTDLNIISAEANFSYCYNKCLEQLKGEVIKAIHFAGFSMTPSYIGSACTQVYNLHDTCKSINSNIESICRMQIR